MLQINIPYPAKRKSWNLGLLSLLTIFVSVGFMMSFKRVKASKVDSFPSYIALSDRTSGDLSLLTYNIAGLPEIISSAQTSRSSSIRRIGSRLEAFDIVNVQEDFNYHEDLYTDNLHPYRTVSMGGVPFGDGLSTLSKYPLVETQRIAWDSCSGADCLTPKGFSFSRVQLAKEVFVDVYNIHATAQDHEQALRARGSNLNQFLKFIETHSKGNALLIMGDFNAHYAFYKDHIRQFQQAMNLQDAWVSLCNAGVIPEEEVDFQAQHALMVHDGMESIDKIYFRNSDELIFKAKRYRVEKELFTNDEGEPLSDHCAVSLTLGWELKTIRKK
ncbi:endonuclease/exonuclease/phosphatase family protein [Sphingobacterium sp. HJSM2_6]|uniref:endonuclease/exonuclease/phosphatase family protein n=1 Tax=Sphingobacterium sp. HJSM2_6 TaxID=3366264 RepID=UPI003BEE92C6